MTLLAVDFNHWKKVSSWPTLSAAVDAFILKATQYTTFTDSDFAGNLAQARKQTGKCIGVYHFVGRNGMQTAKLPPGDPVAEANWFLSKYAHQPGEMIIVDYEPDAEPADPDGWLAAHCARIIAVTGVIPVIYMNSSTASARSWAKTRALGCALWTARYYANTGQIAGPDPSVGAWGSFIGWQYTSNGTLPGISAAVDLSRFDLTADQWRAYGTSNGDDMPLTDADAAVIWNHVLAQKNGLGPASAAQWLQDTLTHANAADDKLNDVHSWLRGGDKDHDNIFLIWSMLRGADPSTTSLDALAAKVEEITAKVAQAQAPAIDEAKLAAALLSNADAVQSLGKAIADNLQLSPRTA